MKKNIELGFIDHLLVLVSCTSALYALGEGLSRHSLAVFLAVGAGISILTGYFVSKSLVGKKAREYDGYIWTGLAFATAIFSRPLNSILPDEGFPFVLFAGAWLSWMILLCGLVSWRDQTLLFLSLPCISIFALVGTFDTFAPATLLFFVFLVCSSLLYARINQRAMIARARLAGYESPELLERDVWRWMAGPEWAFVSAGTIVVLSLVFGPLLRFSLQPVAGSVRVSMPTPTTSNPIANALRNTELQVGKGPIDLSNDVVLRVKVDQPDYLRTSYYIDYQGNGWNRPRTGNFNTILGFENVVSTDMGKWVTPWPDGLPLEPIDEPETKEITFLGPTRQMMVLPAPGPVIGFRSDTEGTSTFSLSGLLYRPRGLGEGEKASLRYLAPKATSQPGSSVFPERLKGVDQYFTDYAKVPATVKAFAVSSVSGAKNDFEKARLLKEAIARTALYTLKAPAVSPTKDAVEQFLFETKKGYCDLFATSMVMCARSVGLRARYTIGFLINDRQKSADGYFDVLASDSHAWAEIYLDGQGWVKFDATEGAALAPDEADETQKGWYQQRWVPFAGGAILVALVAGSVMFFRTRTSVKSDQRPVSTRHEANLAHQQFDRAIRRHLGTVRRFSQTTTEYVTAVLPALGTAGDDAARIAKRLEIACFGPEEPGKEAIRILNKDIKDFGRALSKLPRP